MGFTTTHVVSSGRGVTSNVLSVAARYSLLQNSGLRSYIARTCCTYHAHVPRGGGPGIWVGWGCFRSLGKGSGQQDLSAAVGPRAGVEQQGRIRPTSWPLHVHVPLPQPVAPFLHQVLRAIGRLLAGSFAKCNKAFLY